MRENVTLGEKQYEFNVNIFKFSKMHFKNVCNDIFNEYILCILQICEKAAESYVMSSRASYYMKKAFISDA